MICERREHVHPGDHCREAILTEALGIRVTEDQMGLDAQHSPKYAGSRRIRRILCAQAHFFGYPDPMTHTFSADSAAQATETWSLVSEPARWPEWAPHIRGAWGLGSPEVQRGRRGAARVLWLLPIPRSFPTRPKVVRGPGKSGR